MFGADGIVSFDPFHLDVTVYASIDAGVTIDLWFAEITISVHLSARLRVTGPDFHVVARFEVGPVGLTFEIGPSDDLPDPLSWAAFVAKYLEEAATGTARALTAVTGAGTVPPAGGAAAGGDTSPDGQPDRPFVVVAEFTATLTSTIPLRQAASGDATPTDLAVSHTLSVAPMGADGRATPLLRLRVRPRLTSGAGAGGPDTSAADRVGEPRRAAAAGRRVPDRRLGCGAGPDEPDGAGRRRALGRRPRAGSPRPPACPAPGPARRRRPTSRTGRSRPGRVACCRCCRAAGPRPCRACSPGRRCSPRRSTAPAPQRVWTATRWPGGCWRPAAAPGSRSPPGRPRWPRRCCSARSGRGSVARPRPWRRRS
nr:DUF6603 domain-containing protein [Angustibacter aerolatus]